jgi:hypothetical protein
MDIGGAIKSVTKGDDDWWQFDGNSTIEIRISKSIRCV